MSDHDAAVQGHRGADTAVLALPERALGDQSPVRRPGEFLRESAGRQAPPA